MTQAEGAKHEEISIKSLSTCDTFHSGETLTQENLSPCPIRVSRNLALCQ